MWNLNIQTKSLEGCYLLHRKLNCYEKNLNKNTRFTNWNCIFLCMEKISLKHKMEIKTIFSFFYSGLYVIMDMKYF